MRDDELDDRLRRLFGALKDDDERRAPAADPLLQPARRGGSDLRTPAWPRLGLFAAVAVSLVLATSLWYGRTHHAAAPDEPAWEALTNWSAATDVLAYAPGTPWGNTVTTPSDILIQRSSPPTQSPATEKESS